VVSGLERSPGLAHELQASEETETRKRAGKAVAASSDLDSTKATFESFGSDSSDAESESELSEWPCFTSEDDSLSDTGDDKEDETEYKSQAGCVDDDLPSQDEVFPAPEHSSQSHASHANTAAKESRQRAARLMERLRLREEHQPGQPWLCPLCSKSFPFSYSWNFERHLSWCLDADIRHRLQEISRDLGVDELTSLNSPAEKLSRSREDVFRRDHARLILGILSLTAPNRSPAAELTAISSKAQDLLSDEQIEDELAAGSEQCPCKEARMLNGIITNIRAVTEDDNCTPWFRRRMVSLFRGSCSRNKAAELLGHSVSKNAWNRAGRVQKRGWFHRERTWRLQRRLYTDEDVRHFHNFVITNYVTDHCFGTRLQSCDTGEVFALPACQLKSRPKVIIEA
jgi:hypothetical protein